IYDQLQQHRSDLVGNTSSSTSPNNPVYSASISPSAFYSSSISPDSFNPSSLPVGNQYESFQSIKQRKKKNKKRRIHLSQSDIADIEDIDNIDENYNKEMETEAKKILEQLNDEYDEVKIEQKKNEIVIKNEKHSKEPITHKNIKKKESRAPIDIAN